MDIQHLFVAGINYKKNDIGVRGSFALSPEQYLMLLGKAKSLNYTDLFVLSTCNRTEVYGVVDQASDLVDLLCEFTKGSKEVLLEKGYIKNGCFAAEHLFNVSAGLDSQILGDYEIVGQLKSVVKTAKACGTISSFLERLTNTAFQASKIIKNTTKLSGGTISVAFSAIQYLKKTEQSFRNKKVIIMGAGKIGKNTCKNLKDYLKVKDITIVNRTNEKAQALAVDLDIDYAPFENYSEQLRKADVVIVATNAETPVLNKEDFKDCGNKILIDLSVPNNIDVNVKELEHISLANVDDLSKINDETLEMREAEVPKAKKIIMEHADEFYNWYKQRKNAPLIRTAKQKMLDLNNKVFVMDYNQQEKDMTVHRVIKTMAVKMRADHRPGCIYLEALNDFIAQKKSS